MILLVGGDGASLDLHASGAAGGRADTISSPSGDDAVDGAELSVADAVHLSGAFVAAVSSSGVNVEGASLDASAAGLGAGAPGVPGVYAVDGARVGVAVILN
jgi:hypothetical protein